MIGEILFAAVACFGFGVAVGVALMTIRRHGRV